MSDRELLELAAKAIGEQCSHFGGREYGLLKPQPNVMQPYVRWNPLDDDGDALRLAVKLGISMQHSATIDTHEPNIETFDSKDRFGGWFEEVKGGDPFAAARRAIVRAAAEIGRQMQEGGAA